jgi:hypothetical protein
MKAVTEYPIHELIASRWSPYSFANLSVTDEDLRSLFEAVRWAPSSYNEQPWSYIVAKREDADEFGRLLSCLVEANQTWAKAASVLALGISRLNFARNNEPNRAAISRSWSGRCDSGPRGDRSWPCRTSDDWYSSGQGSRALLGSRRARTYDRASYRLRRRSDQSARGVARARCRPASAQTA